jgi:hypothetical protein
MRRPVLYLAGLLLATGASLALAGPATAAPSHDSVKSHSNHYWDNDDECDEDYDNWYFRQHHRHHNHGGNFNSYSSTSNSGFQLLSGNIIDLL